MNAEEMVQSLRSRGFAADVQVGLPIPLNPTLEQVICGISAPDGRSAREMGTTKLGDEPMQEMMARMLLGKCAAQLGVPLW